jgi:HSP90 family molecular chaperone
LEINPSHPIIVALSKSQQMHGNTGVAPLIAQQLMDNALITAGLIDDPRMMIPRLNDILLATLKKDE